jgi:TonB family protein
VLPLLFTIPVLAQETPLDRTQLPQVVSAVAPEYPEAALEKGLSGQVLLEVAISETGQVIGVGVVEGSGSGFDESAVQAMYAYVWSPAIDAQGTPAAAVIRYRIVFDPQIAPPVRVRGQVTRLDYPVGAAEIRALGPSGQLTQAVSDSDGNFAMVGLEPGPWILSVASDGLTTETLEVRVEADSIVELQVPMTAPDFEPQDEADATVTIRAQRVSPEVTERRLTAEEIQYLPGSSGDVVKAIQNLPGIARAPLGIGQLIVRGNNPEDTAYNLDGSPIPLVFHFGGLTSVVSSDLLDEVAFLPGNYSVRYGRKLGGVVDLRTTSGLPDESKRYVSVDLYQSALFVQQRLGERSALTIAGRRSYADVVLGPVLNQVDGLRVQAPRYYDGQIRFQYQGDAGDWDLMVFASDDRFRFLGGDEDGEELVVAGFADQFQRVRLRHLYTVGEWNLENNIAFGPERRFFEFASTTDAEEQTTTLSVRQEWSRPLIPGRNVGARLGLDMLAGQEQFNFYVAGFGEREKDAARFVAPAFYSEASLRLGPVIVTPGLRADILAYDTGYAITTLDPRLGARADMPWGSTQFKASVGKYSSFAGLREVSNRAQGNPDIGAEYALQASAGVDQELPYGFRLEATVFSNWLYDLVVGREDRLEFFSGPPPIGPFDTGDYANDGVGLSYGAELLLRYDGKRSLGLVTATFSHSERQDRADDPVELFAYDQPIVLNALYTQKLGRGWRVGARYRYGSGNPFTEVVNRYYDDERRAYVPVYGERSASRLAPFQSLDVRVDKLWELKRVDLTGYLEVQNVTYAKNVEVMGWNFDYTEETPITGLPPLPVFGIKASW